MILKSVYKYIGALFSMASVSYALAVEPIQNQYSNVFPELFHQTLEVFRSNDIDGPWYISFNLLTPANIHVGAQAFNKTNGTTCCFNISSIRIVTIDGNNVAFGTDAITDNPFPEPVEHLVSVENLPAGNYAIEVSGSGNREQLTFGGKTEASDFITRLSVTSASTDTEFERGRQFGRQQCIENPLDCEISISEGVTLTKDLNMHIPIINWTKPEPVILWSNLEYVPNDYILEPNDILFKVTDYGIVPDE